MKKIISTKGFLDGRHDATWTTEAIRDRVDFKLVVCYRQDYGGDIQVCPQLSYELLNGEVTLIELSYTIDNPTPERLKLFREECENFYELYGFVVDTTNSTPRVCFRATDLYDMASLIHALDYQSVNLESIMCPVDASLTEKDAIYSPSGSYILQIPDVEHYSIKEGTIFIAPMAARHCTKLQKLDVPLSMLFDEDSLEDYPKGLMIKEWTTHYDGSPDEDDNDTEDEPYVDDNKGVAYSEDGKVLKFSHSAFDETHYEVPDGVEEIEDFAFLSSRQYLELSIPRSVRIIGDTIFGNGGIIVVRDK
jgi:hypothetical protein